MSLPPGFLDDLRAQTSIARIAGRKVTWDAKKSNPSKGDYWAPCPFHQEKTASFHVDDKKGFYYCFGCHAKGDALTFVRETENLSFMEAVETLARDAGLQMPARDPEAARRAEARKGLAEIMEDALRFYRLQLSSSAAAPARAYLEKRGLKAETIERFEIGFAPNARRMLFEHLTGKGIAPAELDKAGLCALPEDGGQPYDRFRDRILFPIRNAQSACIAFGGRAMAADARAKYLNSPETPLFDKGRALYNHGPAREAAGKAGQLIVAEGYMDVIALAEAGLGHAVAPLGTAITEHQLALLWRMADEPVIMLDGDRAGLSAAMRLIPLALPRLAPGKTLRFALLPEKMDPDDLIRREGRKAVETLCEEAIPLVRLLWRNETEDRVFDSPERRAALDASLREQIGKIPDPSIRFHYEQELNGLKRDLFRPARPAGGPGNFGTGQGRQPWRRGAPGGPLPATRSSRLARSKAGDEAGTRGRESLILALILAHPGLLERHESTLEALHFLCPDLEEIHRALLQVAGTDLSSLHERLEARLGFAPLARLTALPEIAAVQATWPNAPLAEGEKVLLEAMSRHRADLGHEAELRDAEEEMTGHVDEGLTWRVSEAANARHAAARNALGDGDTTGRNDAKLRADLQALIDAKPWLKQRK